MPTVTSVASGNYEVDPISRIEGHLGIKVTVDASGKISEANAHGNLWRGFENFLIGRNANDAITFTQRICGVCPVPHGTAATNAAESVLGVSEGYVTFDEATPGAFGIPAAALLVRNIVLGSEFLMSSMTHFYHLAALSYVQGPAMPPWTPFYANQQYHPFLRNADASGTTRYLPDHTGGTPTNLWSAVIKQYVKALRIRRLTLEAGALFAGRMPMTSTLVAGGATNVWRDASDFSNRITAYKTAMKEVGSFVIEEYIPLVLALGALYPAFDNKVNAGVLNSVGLNFGIDGSGDAGIGAGVGNFLAWGGFPAAGAVGTLLFPGGTWVGATHESAGAAGDTLCTNAADVGAARALVESKLTESIAHSRYAAGYGYADATGSAYPGDVTRTVPKRDDEDKYSWLKAPRWGGLAMEVGPLARQVVAGNYPLGETLFDALGGAYATIYTTNGTDLDTTVLHPDLVAGLSNANGSGTSIVSLVQTWLNAMTLGISTMDRLRARAIESYFVVTAILGTYNKANARGAARWTGGGWIDQLQALGWNAPTYKEYDVPVGIQQGFGLVEAPRGALGHFVTAVNGKINAYQCVVPTTWNGSPKDAEGNPGPIEKAVMGCVFEDAKVTLGADQAESGIEVARVAQSFDPCIACAVH